MAYKIAHELVEEAFNHDRRPYTVVYSIQIFLHCVAVYIEQSKGNIEKHRTRQRPGHIQLLTEVRGRFHEWLGKQSDWQKLNETLKVFSFFMQI